MTISSVVLAARNIETTASFYQTVLGLTRVDGGDSSVFLDADFGRIELVDAVGDVEPTWQPDDLHRGFRHIGFKVDDVDAYYARAMEAGARPHLAPLDANGGVRIAFFLDPDGTLVEVVSGHIEYDRIVSQDSVDREHSLPAPSRPRLDHVTVTTADFERTNEVWKERGYLHAASLGSPGEPRGFDIHYLHDGGVVVEVFTFTAPTHDTPAAPGAPGFQHVVISSDSASQPSHARDEDGLSVLIRPIR